jgi:hypothetical protein
MNKTARKMKRLLFGTPKNIANNIRRRRPAVCFTSRTTSIAIDANAKLSYLGFNDGKKVVRKT